LTNCVYPFCVADRMKHKSVLQLQVIGTGGKDITLNRNTTSMCRLEN